MGNKLSRMTIMWVIITFILVTVQVPLTGADEAADLAKKTQNPISDLISVPFQNNTNFGVGPDDDTQNILNIQPLWPFSLNDDWNLITRTIVPLISQPGLLPGEDRTFGLGDVTFTAFFSPKDSGKWVWGVGPVLLLPTATDDVLGSDEWGLGASVVVLTMPHPWVIGSLFSNVWSVPDSDNQDINLFTWQYFINYNMAGGWYLTSAPIITANWEADSDNRWTVPFGGGVGKIFKIGKRPVNGTASAYWNAEKPDGGPDWQLRLQLQLLFPK